MVLLVVFSWMFSYVKNSNIYIFSKIEKKEHSHKICMDEFGLQLQRGMERDTFVNRYFILRKVFQAYFQCVFVCITII